MNIKELRERKGITQAELAKVMNLSPSTIGMYEQGRRKPDFETATHFARFFGVSLEEVAGVHVTLCADTAREKASDERRELLRLAEAMPEDKIAEAVSYLRYLSQETRAEKAS